MVGKRLPDAGRDGPAARPAGVGRRPVGRHVVSGITARTASWSASRPTRSLLLLLLLLAAVVEHVPITVDFG